MYYTARAPPERGYPPLLHRGGTGGTQTRVFPCRSTTAVGTQPTMARRGSRARSSGSGRQRRNPAHQNPAEVRAALKRSRGSEGHSANISAEKQEVAVSIYSPRFRAHQHQGEALLHSLPPRYQLPLRAQRQGQALSSSSRSPSHAEPHPWAEPSRSHPSPTWLWSARLSPALRETTDVRRQTSESVQDGTRKINSPERST